VSTSAEPPDTGRRPIGPKIEGLAFVLITACSWGFAWPVTKFLLSELPPFTMRSVCSAAGVAFAFAVATLRREALWPPPGQWGLLLVYSMLNFGIFMVFTTLALVLLPASEAVIVTYTLPIWTAALAWPVLGERPTLLRVIAIALGVAGVALLVGVGSAEPSQSRLPGVLAGGLAAVLFGLGAVIAKRAPLAMPLVAGVAWQVMLGIVPLLVPALWETPNWTMVTPLGWLAIGYVAIVPMTVAYLAWFRALRLVSAATASTALLIAPVAGVFSSSLLLGEALGARQLVALALTLTGVALAARE
jgi:probable blue pigment (indigoidine) exporter